MTISHSKSIPISVRQAEALGRTIRSLREETTIRVQEPMRTKSMARLLGVSRMVLYRIETGRTRRLNIALIYGIAKALMITREELFRRAGINLLGEGETDMVAAKKKPAKKAAAKKTAKKGKK